jgi:mono/diheme cytochrome c family protein
MRAGAFLAIVLLLGACGGEESSKALPMPETRPAPALAQAAELPGVPSPTPASPPPKPSSSEDALRDVPEGNLRGNVGNGRELYAVYCTTCHGPSGKGDGPAAVALQPPPANHTNAAYMGTLSDAHVYTVISKGAAAVGKSPLMVPWGPVLSDPQIRDVLAYVRQLSGT